MENDMVRREKRFWDRVAFRYDGFMKRFASEYSEILDRISRELAPEFIVLEVATGTGNVALGISELVESVFATDISAPMIEVARGKAAARGVKNVDFSVQDAYSLGLEDGTFDCAIVVNALHVMQEPGKALSEIQRVLKPDGILICPTFCHGEDFRSRAVSRLVAIAGFKVFTRFSVDSLRFFLEESGLDITDTHVFKGTPPLVYISARCNTDR